jgi:alanine racemase
MGLQLDGAAAAALERPAMPSQGRCWVEVSRAQIAHNFREIRHALPRAVEIMPVVKADAYRHGAAEVSRVLESEGARWLAVSNAEEGVALREAGISARILVMADFLPYEREALLQYHLTPVIHQRTDLEGWDRLARQLGRPLPYHLKIDSGMGRLGLRESPADVVEIVRAHPHAQLEGLMTHFASAADYSRPQTEEQIARFTAVKLALVNAGFTPQHVHLSSSTPVGYGRQEAFGNLVRPGHAIYGYLSPARGLAPRTQLNVAPALTWKASILAIKDVEAGAQIGYGSMFVAPQPMRIAVLAAGYADGIPHRLSNKGRVIAGGRYAPILGAVSMDLTTIDISASPELRLGDPVTLLGREGALSIDAQQIARLAGTISYSVLCGIHARVHRYFI